MSGAHARFLARVTVDGRLARQRRRLGDQRELKRLQRELDNLREHNAKLEALFIDVVEEYMTKEDGKCVGPLSVRVNMMTGRV